MFCVRLNIHLNNIRQKSPYRPLMKARPIHLILFDSDTYSLPLFVFNFKKKNSKMRNHYPSETIRNQHLTLSRVSDSNFI